MPTLDDLVELLARAEAGEGAPRATSMRLPEHVHAAASLATELGMDPSVTVATSEALLDRIRAFARRQALGEHFTAHPADVPSLAAVVSRRVSGTDHPAASRPDLVAEVAAWLEEREPDLVVTGHVDAAVDRVLDHVDLLASGVGRSPAV